MLLYNKAATGRFCAPAEVVVKGSRWARGIGVDRAGAFSALPRAEESAGESRFVSAERPDSWSVAGTRR